jgi:predicted Rossmann fold nucleotide-binding protein DprA/Smf involved in DNA uptake
METMTDLKLALAATRYGRGMRLASRVRRSGVEPFQELWDLLPAEHVRRIEDEATALEEKGVTASLLGSGQYPPRLASVRGAPPVLFVADRSNFCNRQG